MATAAAEELATASRKIELTQADIAMRGLELVQIEDKVEQIELEKKEAMASFKATIDKLLADRNKKKDILKAGYYYEEVACDIKMDTPTKGMKSYIDFKTGETIKMEAMSEQDRQRSLYDRL